MQTADCTEVLVTIGKSDTVAARPGAEGGAWKLQLIEDHSDTVVLTLLPHELPRHALVAHLAKMGEVSWGRLPTRLLFSDSQRELGAEVNAAAGREVAAFMRKGVLSMACMKWPEELLRALKRELELIGEPMVTAKELIDCKAYVFSTSNADPKEAWQEQRDDLERWIKTILAHRGRWVGEIKVEKSPSRRVLSEGRDLAKAKRTVTKLASAQRTSYGDALYEISQALLAWRNGDLSTKEARLAAARAWVEYRFRTASERDRGQYQLGFELNEGFGASSAEKDLLEAGVLHLLNGPFDSGRLAQTSPEDAPYPGWRAPARQRGWFHAWWCVLEVANPDDFGDPRTWLPPDKALADAACGAMPGKVTLRISGSLVPLHRESRTGDQAWSDADSTDCQGHGGQLISWIDGVSSYYASYDGYKAGDGCTRYGLLVVAHGQTEETVIEGRKAWGNAAAKLEARIREQDVRGKRAAPPRSLRVSVTTENFFESLVVTRERLALMAGRTWDGTAHRAVSSQTG